MKSAAMERHVRELMQRLARHPGEADRFFSDPERYLQDELLLDEDCKALINLSRDALMYFDVADQIEPELAEEHPSNSEGRRGLVTLAIGLWGCVAYVVFWLLSGGQL